MILLHQVTDEVNSLPCCFALLSLSCTGNDNLHLLTNDVRQQLRIDMEDWEGNTRYAEYNNFIVGSEQEMYKLSSLGVYSGDASQCIYYCVT